MTTVPVCKTACVRRRFDYSPSWKNVRITELLKCTLKIHLRNMYVINFPKLSLEIFSLVPFS